MSNSIKTSIPGQQGLTEHSPVNHAGHAALAKSQGARPTSKTARRAQNPLDEPLSSDVGHNEHADTMQERQSSKGQPGAQGKEAGHLAHKLSLPQAGFAGSKAPTGFSLHQRSEGRTRAGGQHAAGPLTYKGVDPARQGADPARVAQLGDLMKNNSAGLFAAMDRMAEHMAKL